MECRNQHRQQEAQPPLLCTILNLILESVVYKNSELFGDTLWTIRANQVNVVWDNLFRFCCCCYYCGELGRTVWISLFSPFYVFFFAAQLPSQINIVFLSHVSTTYLHFLPFGTFCHKKLCL